MNWFRVYHGMPSDPKWPIISRRSGQPIGVVVSVWVALLDHASQAEDRGDVSSFDCEAYDALYGYEDGTTQAVYEALESKNMIESGRLRSWDKRQPLREDTGSETAKSSTSRVREYRARQRSETQCNAVKRSETQCNAVKRSETQCNAVKRQEEIREEEKRSEEIKKNTLPPTPSGGNREREAPERPPIDFSHSNGLYHGFKYVWNLWPIQQAEEDAWKEYCIQSHRHVLPDSYALADIIDNLKQNDARWQEGYVPLMSSWLKGQRWKDKPVAEPQPRQRARSSPQSRIDEVNAQAARMSALFDRDGEQTPPEQIPGIEN